MIQPSSLWRRHLQFVSIFEIDHLREFAFRGVSSPIFIAVEIKRVLVLIQRTTIIIILVSVTSKIISFQGDGNFTG